MPELPDPQTIALLKFVLEQCSRHGDLTPLKVQKLAFYACGASLAFGFEEAVNAVEFQAWKHGPVERRLYSMLKEFGATSVPVSVVVDPPRVAYHEDHKSALQDVLEVYGRMTPWALREESHLEDPWRDAYRNGQGEGSPISLEAMKSHFVRKFRAERIFAPRFLVGGGSWSLDGIPLVHFDSMKDLASALSNAGLGRKF